MKVTALKVQARSAARVNVYLDGRFAFGLAKIEAARLRLGQELDEAAVARLQQADEAEAVYERALRFLAVRPRSESEVRQRLRKQGAADGQVEAALDRLRRAGLVDDQAFAAYWVENRTAFRPKSRRVLEGELRRKGVGREEAAQAAAGTNDAALAYAVAAKRAPRLAALPAVDFRRKLTEFLMRRGFDYETAAEAVSRVTREQRAAED
jgi:regulatory protein